MMLKTSGPQEAGTINSLVIKLNNFLLFSASGCILPYLSVYYLHYTEATSIDVGRVMLMSSFFGMLVSLGLCSMADRYRAHRLVYLLTLSLSLLSYTLLFGPIISGSSSSSNPSNVGPTMLDPNGTQLADVVVVVDDEDGGSLASPVDSKGNSSNTGDQGDPPGPSGGQTLWFHLAGACIALGSMTNTVNMSLSDSFSTNIARLCNTSFGSIRFWSSVGWVLASVLLIFLNELPTVPYLSPALGLFTLLTLANLLLIWLWPDARPFDLAEQPQIQQQQQQQVAQLAAASDKRPHQTKFSFRSRRRLYLNIRPAVVIDYGQATGEATPTTTTKSIMATAKANRVDLMRIQRELAFDSRDEDELRNVRRHSLAPLGDSYVIKHYELLAHESAALGAGNRKAARDHQLRRHFNVVTKIEPVDKQLLNTSSNGLKPAGRDWLAPMVNGTGTTGQQQQRRRATDIHDQSVKDELPEIKQAQVMSLQLHFKLIQLIARRNPNMPRFMVLFAIIGLIVANNWFYLFPFMDSVDPGRFHSLAPYVMISAYLSETLFYLAAPKWTGKYFTNHAIGLSLILLVFALRYALYLAPIYWPVRQAAVPDCSGDPSCAQDDYDAEQHLGGGGGVGLEVIIVIELLQSISMGWFNCLFNEAALEFALEAPHCLPQLIELGLLSGASAAEEQRSLELINNGVKLTLLSVSSCCFDGIGVAIGSLAGGWLIDRFGYQILWQTSVLVALATSLANLMLEFSGLFDNNSNNSSSTNKIKSSV